MSVVLIKKYFSIVMKGKRKLCECFMKIFLFIYFADLHIVLTMDIRFMYKEKTIIENFDYIFGISLRVIKHKNYNKYEFSRRKFFLLNISGVYKINIFFI